MAYDMIEVNSNYSLFKKSKISKQGLTEAGFGFTEFDNNRISFSAFMSHYVVDNWHLGFEPMFQVASVGRAEHFAVAPTLKMGYTLPLFRNLAFDLSHLTGAKIQLSNSNLPAGAQQLVDNETMLLAFMPSLRLSMGYRVFSLGVYHRYNYTEPQPQTQELQAFVHSKTRVFAGVSWRLY